MHTKCELFGFIVSVLQLTMKSSSYDLLHHIFTRYNVVNFQFRLLAVDCRNASKKSKKVQNSDMKLRNWPHNKKRWKLHRSLIGGERSRTRIIFMKLEQTIIRDFVSCNAQSSANFYFTISEYGISASPAISWNVKLIPRF